MLLTTLHLRALDALRASDASGGAGRAAGDDQRDVYRALELQTLARSDGRQTYALTDAGREALRLLDQMRAEGLLAPSDQLEEGWRFIGSEVLAALAAADRAGGRVGPLADEVLRERGLAEVFRDPDRKVRYPRLTVSGRQWLAFAQRHGPRLEITGALARSIHGMPPAYVEPHRMGVPGEHAIQLEAMRLVVWSMPDRDVYTFTAVGRAVHEALRKGGYPIADIVLDDAMLDLLAILADKGRGALAAEELAPAQMLGYVDAEGALTPGGEAALRARRLRDAQPGRSPATITITRHEAELLSVVWDLSTGKTVPAERLEGMTREEAAQAMRPRETTKAALHKALVESLERRYQAFVGKYGRKIEAVEARKRQNNEMVAELKDRDRAYGGLDALDELLMHLESFELLRAEGEGKVTVYRLTPNGVRVVHEQGDTPQAVTGMAVKAITVTTMAGHFYAPVGRWIEQAHDEELIGPGGITKAGDLYAWLAEHAMRWPALSRREAHMLMHLPQTETDEVGDGESRAGSDHHHRTTHSGHGVPGKDESEQEYVLDRLEARGLIERMVDGQIVQTASGQLLARAVAGASALDYPVTPAIVRLLLAIRQIGESLYVKEEKVRVQPHQWEEVERLTGLGPDEFRDTVHLAKLGQYIGEANLREAGRDALAALASANDATLESLAAVTYHSYSDL